MLKILEKPLKIWEIIMSIYIIGLINIYNIFTYGLDQIINKANIGGIININEKNIKYLIIINIIILLIFNSSIIFEQGIGIKTIEFIYLIGFGLLGLNLIIISNDLILIFIAIELYSLSVYLLILIKISKITSRISIIYLLINSISSYILLLGIAIIYKYSGSIKLEEIMYIINLNGNIENINKIVIGVLLLVLAILLKLGTVPFNFWVLRLYTALESRILLYQIIIPKLVFIYLLYKVFNTLFIIPMTEYNIFHNVTIINKFYYLLFFISILSVFIGSIAGLFHNYFKALLTYSSILNIGFILLGLSNELIKYSNNTIFYLLDWGIIGGSITFIEYLFIYTINSLSIFFCFLLINPNKSNEIPLFQSFNLISLKKSYNPAYNYPILSLFLLFSIFSFIGIPPFGGFYAKINIFINIIYSYNILSMFSIFFLLLSTFISACFYLKFLLYFFFPLKFNNTIKFDDEDIPFLISDKPISLSYFFSFFSLFLLIYPFFSNFLYPFFYSI